MKKSFKRCYFLKGTVTTSVLSACQIFAECVDDPWVLELLQKCFVRIKAAKQLTAISHENRAKDRKKQQQSWKKKDWLGAEFVSLRHKIPTKNNQNKKSLTVLEATELDWSKVF